MVIKSIRCASALGLVSVFLAACGGTDGGGTASPSSLEPEQCPAVPTPCGGELVGEWEVVDVCSTAAPTHPDADCPAAELTIISVDGEGAQSFLADGTTVSSGAAEFEFRYDLPKNCLARACGELAESLRQNFEDEYEVLNVACEEQSETCICSTRLRETLPGDQDTYQVNGTQVTTVDDDGETSVEDYCVEGDRATFSSDDLIVVLQRK